MNEINLYCSTRQIHKKHAATPYCLFNWHNVLNQPETFYVVFVEDDVHHFLVRTTNTVDFHSYTTC